MTSYRLFAAATVLALSGPAFATGGCPIKDAGPKAEWQDQAQLEKKLVAAGWQVRRIKTDAQCYEVYGVDAAGKRVEAYFHPKTLEPAQKAS